MASDSWNPDQGVICTVFQKRLPFPYDLERIVDDWVLLGFLVGNDFIPHLPLLHIAQDGLPLLWGVYMKVMPNLTGKLCPVLLDSVFC